MNKIFWRCYLFRTDFKKFSCYSHVPVMAQEVFNYLSVVPNSTVLDMTFGGGGHTKYILNEVPDCRIYCLDRDKVAHNKAVDLSQIYQNVVPCHGKFSDLPSIMKSHGVKTGTVDCILFDFGCSSMQFDDASRGFSLSKNGPLDMRMDDTIEFTAADVIDKVSEEDLIKIFKKYGEEKHSKKIARAIVDSRYSFSPIKTTKDLANLVSVVMSGVERTDMLERSAHPATKVFQALRIFVNNELNEINYAILLSRKYLKVGGRLVTLSFHSLEDRIVKRHLHSPIENDLINPLPLKYSSHLNTDHSDSPDSKDPVWMPLTKHVLTPSEDEVVSNPRSRSARLRAAVRIK